MHPGQTSIPIFLGIIVVYMVVSLMIGGKKAYFDPYTEPPEEKKE